MTSRVSNRDAVAHMAVRAEFITHNKTLRGTGLRASIEGINWAPGGYLPPEWAARFYADQAAGIDYLVRSYGTPIGWVTAAGEYVIPDVKYSVTTSRHQGYLRQAWMPEAHRAVYVRSGDAVPTLTTEIGA